jgi:hypothetical protein
MNNDEFDQFLASALERRGQAPAADEAAAARVMARLNGPLPPQHIPAWRRLTALLLDTQFTPAWPRMAALAGCLALGFAIGLSGLDNLDPFYGAYGVGANQNDLSSVVFGPEVLSGAQP